MRWLRGGTVEDRLVDGPLDLDETLRIVDQVGGALSAAHHAGVVHRDIKPGNLLLDDERNVYLSDFGIALVPAQPGHVGDDLRSAGSPAYASPEQMTGQTITPRSDIYSLGVLIFELLTGQLPYRSQTVTSLIGEKLARPAPALSSQRPDLPNALDLVLQRATMPEPEARYASVAELVDALHAAIATAGRMATTDHIAPDRPARVAGRGAHVTMAALAIVATNPYKGLRSFDEADAADFFGRARLVEQVVSELRESRFLAVVGPSGSGKSSVVRAGLVPALRDGAVPGSSRWFVTTMVPGRRPFEELESALLRVAINPPASLLEQLRDGERGMARAVRRSLPSDTTELVLVVDQFEELFTQVDPEERDHFLASLTSAVADDEARLRVVVTVRADYFDRPLTHRSIGELMAAHHVAITPLSAEELERAVAGPAERAGARLEPGLLAAIVADVSDRPAALPLLQYCLTEVYDRRDGLVMTLAAYRELGSVSGALGRRAEEGFQSLDDEDRLAARELFTRLVTPGEGAADTRRRARRSELIALPVGSYAMERVLGAFGSQRLLTFDRDPATREPTVEVGHEALLTEWPRLKAWVDEDREGLRVMRRVAEAGEAWVQGGREEADLLHGARLEAASEWAEANPERLSAYERHFVAASTAARDAAEARERRTTRRLHRLAVGVSAALVIAVIAGTVAVAQRNEATDQRNKATDQRNQATEEARNATVGRMAFQARSLAASNRSQALLLALEADRLLPDDDTLGSLEIALLANPGLLRSVHTATVGNAVFSPDGSRVSGGTPDGRIVEIDTSTGATVREWQVSRGPVFGGLGALGGLAVPPNSSQVLVRDERGGVRVLASDGIANGQLGGTVPVAVAPRQDTVAIATASGVRLVDVASGSVLRTIQGPPATELAFSGDGTRLAIETGVGNIAIVDAATGTTIAPPVTLSLPASIVLNETGTRLGVGGFVDGDAHIVDVATGETLGTPLVDPGSQIHVAFSDDGSLMGAVSGSGAVWIFDSTTGEPVGPNRTAPFGNPSGLGFTSDNATLLIASSSGDIAVIDLVGRETLARPAATTGWLATFSPDGKLFAVPIDDSDNDTAIVDVATGKRLQTLHPARRYPDWGSALYKGPLIAAFSPDGKEVAIGSAAYDGQPAEVEVFSVADGTSLRRLRVPGVPFIGEPLAWSPDGRVIAGGAHDRVIRIDARTGEVLEDLGLDLFHVLSLEYDKDGKLAVAGVPVPGTGGKAWVFDASGQLMRAYGSSTTDPYWFPVWGPGGTLALPNVATGEIRLVEPEADRQAGPSFTGPAGNSAVAVASDGRGGARGVVVGGDDMIQLWDVGTGQPIGEPIRATSSSRAAAISTNSKSAVAQDPEHHRMMIWDLDPAVWRVRACDAAGRNLTREEWTKFLPEGEPYHVTCPQYPAGV